MIRCTLELIPGGVGEPEHLGVIEIANDIVKSINTKGQRGTYTYELQKKIRRRVVHEGVIKDFPRLSYHPWNLVKRILDDAAKQNGGVI